MNDSIVDKIRKLIAHERSARKLGSFLEAAAFAEKIQALLIKHKISIAEVETSDDQRRDAIGEEVHFTTREQVIRRHRRDRSYHNLFNVVVKAHGCDCVSITGYNKIYLIGREEDRAVALAMFSYLLATMKRLASEERRHQKRRRRTVRRWRTSFYLGFIGAIACRYDDLREATDESTALVLKRFDDAVTAKMEELHPGTYNLPSRTDGRLNRAGWIAGATAGHEASLATKVVHGASRVPKLLGPKPTSDL